MDKITITENMRMILNVLQKATNDMTAEDVANATGLSTKAVNATFNRIASEELGLGERVKATLDLGDCKTKDVKLLRLTEKGKALDLHNDIVIKVK